MSSSDLTDSPTFVLNSSRRTAPFGELLLAVFDEASRYSNDPDEVARMATEVVVRMLRRAQLAGRDC